MSFVDERIVDMQFNNKQFESGARQSIQTLEDLQTALKLDDSSQGLEALQRSINSFSTLSLVESVNTIADRFSAMGIIATTTLVHIADEAVRAGEALLKSLTVDNIASGWKKFADNTVSVGTIVSQGYDMKYVEDQLERLMWFTDETSYNYTEMVNTLSKFTASGKNLEDSITAIQGIALWAASAGQNASTAAHAMVQLSQAMSAGIMRRQDWMSIQTANMDVAEFRQIALETAVEKKKLEKIGDDLYKSLQAKTKNGALPFTASQFPTTLTEGNWFDAEVMMAVYEKYGAAADAVREYMEVHEDEVDTASEAIDMLEAENNAIIETYSKENSLSIEEATKALVKQGDILDPLAIKWFRSGQEARTFEDAITSVKDAVSTKLLKIFQDIFGNYEEARTLFTDLANTLWDIFAAPLDELKDLMDAWHDFGGRTHALLAMQYAWEAILALTDPIKEAFRNIFPDETTWQGMVKATYHFGLFMRSLIIGEETAANVKRVFEGLFSVFDLVGQIITAITRTIANFSPNIKAFASGFLDSAGSIGEFVKDLSAATKESDFFYNNIQKVINFVSPAFEFVNEIVSKAITSFEKFTGIDLHIPTFQEFSDALHDIGERFKQIGEIFKPVTDVILAAGNAVHRFFVGLTRNDTASIDEKIGVFERLGILVSTIAKKLEPLGKEIGDAISDVLKNITDALNGFDGGVFVGSATIGGILALIYTLFYDFVWDIYALENPVETAQVVLGTLGMTITNIFKSFEENIKADVIQKIAIAIGILAVSMAILATIDAGKIVVNLGAMYGLIAMMLHTLDVIASIDLANGGILKLGAIILALSNFSTTVLFMAIALKVLSTIKIEDLVPSFFSLWAISEFIGKFIATTAGYSGGMAKATAGMISLSVAVLILSAAVKVLGALPIDQALKGVVGVGTLLGELAIFANFAGEAKHVLGTGAAMIAIALSLTILTGVLFAMGKLADSMGSGLLTLGILLFELATAMHFMESAVPGALAMLVAAAAIAVLTPALILLGTVMNGDSIANSVIALAGALLVLGVAGFAFGSAAGVMLLGALAIGALGAAILVTGAGLAVFGAGLTAFTTGLLASCTVIIGGVGVLAKALEVMIDLIVSAILGLLKRLLMIIPDLVNIGMMFIEALLKGIADHLPGIASSAMLIILTFLVTVNQYIDVLIDAGIKLMVSFINGMANGIRDNTETILIAIGNLLSAIIEAVLTAIQLLVKDIPVIGGELSGALGELKGALQDAFAPEEMGGIAKDATESMTHEFVNAEGEARTYGGKIGRSFGESIADETEATEEGAKSLTDTLGETLGGDNTLKLLNDAGQTDIDEWLSGIGSKDVDTESMAELMRGLATSNMDNSEGSFTDAGSDGVLGYIAGLGSHDEEVKQEALRLVNLTTDTMRSKPGLDSHSPSKKTYKIGIDGGRGFILGLESTIAGAKRSAAELGDSSAEALKDAVDANVGILDYADHAVGFFNTHWAMLQDDLGDTRSFDISTDALELLALQLYEASIAAEDADDRAKRAAKSQVEILQDVKKAYITVRDEFKKTISNQTDMFKMFDFGEAVKSGDMIDRFESNLTAMKDFSRGLESLAERGIERGLLEHFAQEGPKALGDMKAFLQATDEEFLKLNKDWQEQGQLLDDIADRYMSTLAFANSHSQEGFNRGLDPETGENTGKTYIESTLSGMREALGINLQEFEAVGEIAADAIGDGFEKASSSSSSTNKKTKDAATTMSDSVVDTVDTSVKKEDGINIGYRLCEGIAEGLRKGIELATTAAEELAVSIIARVKEVFDEHSPSRVFADIGYYADAGLANGFVNNGKIVRTAAAEAALGAVDELTGVFGRIADVVDGQIDLDPTIRPVLDLSSIQYGAGQIGTLLGLNDPYALNATASLAEIQNGGTSLDVLSGKFDKLFKELSSEGKEIRDITIHIYPTENQDANEIADAVGYKINHDVLKKSAAKGGH